MKAFITLEALLTLALEVEAVLKSGADPDNIKGRALGAKAGKF